MIKFENYLHNTNSKRNQFLAEAIIGDKSKKENIGFDQEDIDWLQNNFHHKMYAPAMFQRWQHLKEFLKERDKIRMKKVKKIKSEEKGKWFLKNYQQEAEQRMNKYHPEMRGDMKDAYIDYYTNMKYLMRAAAEVDAPFMEKYLAEHPQDIYDFKGVQNYPEDLPRSIKVDSRIPNLIRKYEGELGSSRGIDLGGVSDKSDGSFSTRGGSFKDRKTVYDQIKNWIAASATGMLAHEPSPEEVTGHIEIEDPYTSQWHKNNVRSDIKSAIKQHKFPGTEYKKLNKDDKINSNINYIKSFVSNPKILNYLDTNPEELERLKELGPGALSNAIIDKIISVVDKSHTYHSGKDFKDDQSITEASKETKISDKEKMINVLNDIKNESDPESKTEKLRNILTTSKETEKLINLLSNGILQSHYSPIDQKTKLWGAKPFTKSESPEFAPLPIKQSHEADKRLISSVRAPATSKKIRVVDANANDNAREMDVDAPILYPAGYHKINDEDLGEYLNRKNPEDSELARKIVARGSHRRHDEEEHQPHHYDPTKVPTSPYHQGTTAVGPGMINFNYEKIPSYYRDVTNPFVREVYQMLSMIGAGKDGNPSRCNIQIETENVNEDDWGILAQSGKIMPRRFVEKFNLTPSADGDYLCFVAKEIINYLCAFGNERKKKDDCSMLDNFKKSMKDDTTYDAKLKVYNKNKMALNFHHTYDVVISYVLRHIGNISKLNDLDESYIKENVKRALDAISSRDLGWGNKESSFAEGEEVESGENYISKAIHEQSIKLDKLFHDILKSTVSQCKLEPDPNNPSVKRYSCKYQDMFNSKIEPFIHDVAAFLEEMEDKKDSLRSDISLSDILQINEATKDAILGIIKLYTLNSFKKIYYARFVHNNKKKPDTTELKQIDQDAKEDTLNYIDSIERQWSSMSNNERSSAGKKFFDNFLQARLRQVENIGNINTDDIAPETSPFSSPVKMGNRPAGVDEIQHYKNEISNSYGKLIDSLSDTALHSPSFSSFKTHLYRDRSHVEKNNRTN